ncbi:MAG: amylo-alpha-1,6-glucosidase [Bacteroidales bacterium]|jgi:predicted glycogen debranching enzyme|nr:amylo-alpha-1,6-glucosidase [Bacteroidales bacterium]
MGYINFDKSQVVNLEYSLSREIVRTNRAGSYSSTTIVGCNTRKYHGLLVCPVKDFGNERHVLLSALDLTVIQDGKSFNTGVRKYKGDFYNPKGHKYIEDFSIEYIPKMEFRVGGVFLRQERLLVHYEEQLLYKYTVLEAAEPLTLQIRPFLAFRNIHSLTRANMSANTRVEYEKNGINICLYEGFPTLHMQTSCNAEFVPVPDWYLGVEYLEEQKRGYDYSEDLFNPGFFEIKAKEGDVIIFSASTKEENPGGFKAKFTRVIKRKVPRDSYEHCLENAAQQFIEKHDDDTLIIAGYPWFGAWGRDTFISLPGISQGRNREGFFEEVLDTQVARLKDGLFPNMGDPGNPAYNSVDAPLWFFWALQQYEIQTGKSLWQRYEEAAVSILRAYRDGTHYNIHMRDNGLIYAAAPGKALTWMDAVVEGTPVTPRSGYAVEINALWHNAVCYTIEMAAKHGNKKLVREFEKLPDLMMKSFISVFWDEKEGILADSVNDDSGKDMALRPNMLMAVSLPHSMLTLDQMKRILDRAAAELLTPRGLRTLTPRDRHYCGIYAGSQAERDSAYHQGTAWPWLIGPFCDGWLKVYGKAGASRVSKIIDGFEEVMNEHGVTTISEIYDGDPPHLPRGAISQAWSVAEVLRIMKLLKSKYQ